jgi:hypothetical protein
MQIWIIEIKYEIVIIYANNAEFSP